MSKGFEPYPFSFMRGKIVPVEDAKVSIMTNALQYGGGVFGGIRGYPTPHGLSVFRLDEHLSRLKASCELMEFLFTFDKAQIKSHFIELIKCNKPDVSTYFRPFIYRSDTHLSPDIEGDYDFALYMLKMPHYFDPSRGLKVRISSWQRISDNVIPPKGKVSGGYVNSALAIHEARKDGFDSAIMLNRTGNVSEGAVMNVFLVKKGKLITPDLNSDILEGITRRTVIELATEMGIAVQERPVTPQELIDADEVFFSGTAANISWCAVIDSTTIGKSPGPITQKLATAFTDLLHTHPHLFTAVHYIPSKNKQGGKV